MDSNIEQHSTLTYDQIIATATLKANELRGDLPLLPTNEELEPFQGKMWAIDRPLIDTVRRHLDEWGVAHGHAFREHHEKVAVYTAYVANIECKERNITGELRDQIIQRSWRLGLLHDLQRWRGFDALHQIEGMRATRQKLEELGIADSYLADQVLLHDRMEVEPRNNPAFDIPFFSAFAVDHFNWGTEWEQTRWEGLAKKGLPPEQAIHDYQFMYKLRVSPNLQQTKWGREIALPYINFGFQIAQKIEQTFSRN